MNFDIIQQQSVRDFILTDFTGPTVPNSTAQKEKPVSVWAQLSMFPSIAISAIK
jgi:hypothetical protein